MDELSLCDVCGDRYVYRGRTCHVCLQQQDIDAFAMDETDAVEWHPSEPESSEQTDDGSYGSENES